MFGRPKYMHIATAEDDEIEAFVAEEVNVLQAFCGATIARGWLFTYGGAPTGSSICPDCAAEAGWDYDAETGEWAAPYEEAHQ